MFKVLFSFFRKALSFFRQGFLVLASAALGLNILSLALLPVSGFAAQADVISDNELDNIYAEGFSFKFDISVEKLGNSWNINPAGLNKIPASNVVYSPNNKITKVSQPANSLSGLNKSSPSQGSPAKAPIGQPLAALPAVASVPLPAVNNTQPSLATGANNNAVPVSIAPDVQTALTSSNSSQPTPFDNLIGQLLLQIPASLSGTPASVNNTQPSLAANGVSASPAEQNVQTAPALSQISSNSNPALPISISNLSPGPSALINIQPPSSADIAVAPVQNANSQITPAPLTTSQGQNNIGQPLLTLPVTAAPPILTDLQPAPSSQETTAFAQNANLLEIPTGSMPLAASSGQSLSVIPANVTPSTLGDTHPAAGSYEAAAPLQSTNLLGIPMEIPLMASGDEPLSVIEPQPNTLSNSGLQSINDGTNNNSPGDLAQLPVATAGNSGYDNKPQLQFNLVASPAGDGKLNINIATPGSEGSTPLFSSQGNLGTFQFGGTNTNTNNVVMVSDYSQQYLSSLVNVNAAGSIVPVLINIVINIDSNIANLSTANSLDINSNYYRFAIN